MTDKTQAEAHSCINPQCNPAKCSGCACAIPPSDEAGHVVLSLLNAFAVNDLGHPFEDGDSAVVDRARQWLQNRSTALQAAPPAPAAVAVPEGWVLVPVNPTAEMCKAANWSSTNRQRWADMIAVVLSEPQAHAAPNGCQIDLARMREAALHAQVHGYQFKAAGTQVSQVIDMLLEKTYELATARAALAAAPAQEHATQLAGQAIPRRQWTDGTRPLKQDVLGAIHDYSRTKPEDDPEDPESWESWFEAAFDLLGTRVSDIFDEHAAPAQAQEDARDGLGQAVRDVVAEIERAQRKFPTWPTDPLHALAVLGEEFGELTKDVLQLTYEPSKTTLENMATEARQTAAMALRFYVSLPFYQLTPGVQHDPVKLAAIDAARAAQGGATP